MYTLKNIDDISSHTNIYNNYKLCYIDGIPQTYWDWTPETKEFMETEEYKNYKAEEEAERDKSLKEQGFYSYISHPIHNKLQGMDYPNPDYIIGKQTHYAYFTPIPLIEQWGDDWDDQPYEHNAEIPYDDYYNENDEQVEIEIIKIPFYINRDNWYIKFPEDYGGGNSPFSVKDINAGAVAWIYAKTDNKKIDGITIHAGVNPTEFIDKIQKINELYPYVGEED